MAQVAKIDSNSTGLAYAEEQSLGTLPGSPDWRRLNPNSYTDFGGEISTVAPNPIRDDRQRRKGVTVDLDASGGFNHNLTYTNFQHMMQGVMFADIRSQAEEAVTAVDTDTVNPDEYEVADTTGFVAGHLIQGSGFTNSGNNTVNKVTAIVSNTSVEVADGTLTAEASPPSAAKIKVVGFQFDADDAEIDVSGDLPQLVSQGGGVDFTTLGVMAGQWIYIGGDGADSDFATAANNGFKRVRSVSASAITLDKSAADMSNEAVSGGEEVQIFFGDLLKNEPVASDIVRRTYHVERLLGAPDDSSTDVQSEVLKGAVPNEFVLNIPQADLVNFDVSFVATDNQQLTAGNTLQSSVTEPAAADEFNTSSDVARINLGTVSSTDEAPDALFTYVTELTLTINNNVTPNKAVGTLGAFDVTAGTFQVSAEITAYFANVSAVQAVRNNSDITLDVAFVKDNQGMIFDLPLVALGNGRLNVELDQPITLPLSSDAANGDKVNSNLNHTLAITYFDYLPTAA